MGLRFYTTNREASLLRNAFLFSFPAQSDSSEAPRATPTQSLLPHFRSPAPGSPPSILTPFLAFLTLLSL